MVIVMCVVRGDNEQNRDSDIDIHVDVVSFCAETIKCIRFFDGHTNQTHTQDSI